MWRSNGMAARSGSQNGFGSTSVGAQSGNTCRKPRVKLPTCAPMSSMVRGA